MRKIYKLNFQRVHLGDGLLEDALYSFDSGRLFSALCHEALQQGGQAVYNQLVEVAKGDCFQISDCFPYNEHGFFLPKPMVKIERNQEMSDEDGRRVAKKAKKLQYVLVDKYADFISGTADLGRLSELQDFGKSISETKVSIEDYPKTASDRTEPYQVGVYSFKDDAGLYFFANIPDDFVNPFENLLTGLQYAGIGGKRTAGLGRFKLEIIDSIQTPQNTNNIILISTAIPKDDELNDELLNNAQYLLKKSSGFIQSQNGGELIRKRDLHKFRAGSVFARKFQGEIVDVSPLDYPHLVHNYAKAMWLSDISENFLGRGDR